MANVLYRNRDRETAAPQHLFGKCADCHLEVEALPAEVMASPDHDGNAVSCPDCPSLIKVKPLAQLDEKMRAHFLKRLGVQTAGLKKEELRIKKRGQRA